MFLYSRAVTPSTNRNQPTNLPRCNKEHKENDLTDSVTTEVREKEKRVDLDYQTLTVPTRSLMFLYLEKYS